MPITLTFQSSIFYCTEEQLLTFNKAYSRWQHIIQPIETTPLNKEDTHAAVFNTWLSLNSFHQPTVMKTSRYFSHSLCFYLFSLFDSNKDILLFIEKNKNNVDALFLLAYAATQKLLLLIHNILMEFNLSSIIKHLHQMKYFQLKDVHLPPNEVISKKYFRQNKKVTNLIANDYKRNHRFQFCINHALAQTTSYLQSNLKTTL